MKPPKIFVIHRSEDEIREAFILRKYAEANLDFEFFFATDGHSFEALSPYRTMVPSHFWGQNEIKPGAFACFISHMRAWQAVADGADDFAIIAEDDSAPSPEFLKHWPKYQNQIEKCDLLFVNNRTSEWVEKSFESLGMAIKNLSLRPSNDKTLSTAPGADGYVLTKDAAKKLVDLSLDMRAICGVDWFLIAAFWDKNSKHIPQSDEFEFIAREFASQVPLGKAKISREPLFTIDRSHKSSIVHAHKLPIQDLLQNLIDIRS